MKQLGLRQTGSVCANPSWMKQVLNVFVFFFLSVSSFVSLSGGEGSAEAGQKETSTCDICQFGAECDVDAEDVW